MSGWEIPAAMLAASALSAGASYAGSQSVNSANANINRQTMMFNDRQAAAAYERNMNLQTQQFIYNSAMNEVARGYASNEANLSRNWSEYMSNTSYQRARRDMIAAGLNPILAYQQGGATSPPAAMASASSQGVSGASVGAANAGTQHRMENALGPAVSSAMQGAQTVASLRQATAQTEQTQAQTELTGAQVDQSRTQSALNIASAASEAKRAGLLRADQAASMALPALRNAQTQATSAQGALAAEQTRTEAERQPLTRAQTASAIESANLTRTQDRFQQNFGAGQGIGQQIGQGLHTVRTFGDSVGNAFNTLRSYFQ